MAAVYCRLVKVYSKSKALIDEVTANWLVVQLPGSAGRPNAGQKAAPLCGFPLSLLVNFN